MSIEQRIKRLEQAGQVPSEEADRAERLKRMCAEKARELQARMAAEEEEEA